MFQMWYEAIFCEHYTDFIYWFTWQQEHNGDVLISPSNVCCMIQSKRLDVKILYFNTNSGLAEDGNKVMWVHGEYGAQNEKTKAQECRRGQKASLGSSDGHPSFSVFLLINSQHFQNDFQLCPLLFEQEDPHPQKELFLYHPQLVPGWSD